MLTIRLACAHSDLDLVLTDAPLSLLVLLAKAWHDTDLRFALLNVL